MMNSLTKDSLAIILICSNIGLNMKDEEGLKPYTTSQWNKLAEKIMQSSLKRPEALFSTDEQVWSKELYLKENEIIRLKKLLARAGQLGVEIEQLQSQGINITTRAERTYPKRLKDVLKKNSPPLLYYCGNLSLLDTKSVAVVGSRDIDEAGLNYTKKFAARCAAEGLTIVSGGAKGVDTIAQDTALSAGGNVISVLSDSLSKKIKQKEVREAITKGKLLLFSAVSPKAGFTVYSAMDRNKYIYGLSDFAVVISSDDNKGGTWSGATENLNNKWVSLFVRQENDIPKGNEKLLNMGAKPLSNEILDDKNICLFNWLNDNKSIMQDKEEYTQLGLLDINSDNYLIYNREGSEDKIGEYISESSLANQKLDLYEIVWPYLERALHEPKSDTELTELFNVKQNQLIDWINRALNEKKIIKLSDSEKYTLANVQLGDWGLVHE